MILQIAAALAIGAYVVLSKDAQPKRPAATLPCPLSTGPIISLAPLAQARQGWDLRSAHARRVRLPIASIMYSARIVEPHGRPPKIAGLTVRFVRGQRPRSVRGHWAWPSSAVNCLQTALFL